MFCPTVMFRYNIQHENARAPKVFSGHQPFPFSSKANVKTNCFVKARPHYRVIDRCRARWKSPVWRPTGIAMTDVTRIRKGASRRREPRENDGPRLTSLFSCASADLKVRLIHSFTSKMSSENAETS